MLSCFILKFLRCLISRLRDELFPPVEALDLGYTPPEVSYILIFNQRGFVVVFTPGSMYWKTLLVISFFFKISDR